MQAGKARGQHAEIRHGGLAEDHAAGLAHARRGRRVGRLRRCVRVRARADRRGIAARVDVLLDRDRHAVERGERPARPPARLRGMRALERGFAMDPVHGIEARLAGGDALEARMHDLHRRDLGACVCRCKLGGAALVNSRHGGPTIYSAPRVAHRPSLVLLQPACGCGRYSPVARHDRRARRRVRAHRRPFQRIAGAVPRRADVQGIVRRGGGRGGDRAAQRARAAHCAGVRTGRKLSPGAKESGAAALAADERETRLRRGRRARRRGRPLARAAARPRHAGALLQPRCIPHRASRSCEAASHLVRDGAGARRAHRGGHPVPAHHGVAGVERSSKTWPSGTTRRSPPSG